MTLLLTILILFDFLMIAYQDFKSKLVSWFLFPIAFILLALYNISIVNLYTLLTFFLLNIIIIAFLILVLIVYFFIKNKKFINIFNEYIGLGDILLFVILGIAFSPMNFIIFMVLSLTITLIIFAVRFFINKNVNRYIPLAGLFSIYFSLIFTCNTIFNKPEMFNDNLINNYIAKIIL